MKRSMIILLALTIWVTAAGHLLADDTEIYGASSVAVDANVLIIFDTSGSMDTKDVPSEYYDSSRTYTGSYTSSKVYERKWSWDNNSYYYTEFATSADDLSHCSEPYAELISEGVVTAAIRTATDNYECDGGDRDLVMGNFLNYDSDTTLTKSTRTSVAKTVVTNLINSTDNVRFGLMRFNNNQGGRVVKPIGSSKADLIAAIEAFPADGYTPLAETLAEAGLYFAQKESWFNKKSDGTYVDYATDFDDPILYRCQKNYIILMTDGEPTKDLDSKLVDSAYVNANGDKIGDYDHDGKDPGSYSTDGSDYLDDVAKYLYVNDIRPDLGESGAPYVTQNIVTYTIGFQTTQQLLQDTAANSGNPDGYFTAKSISGLTKAFERILKEINANNLVFVAPVVPVSRMNRTFAGNNIYIGFFSPESDGTWIGNLKKFGYSDSGVILDALGNPATDSNGQILSGAVSYWTEGSPDGAKVDAGGIGAKLVENTSRNLYTYLGTNTDLTADVNAFSKTNSDLTPTLLGVSDTAAAETLIDEVHKGYGSADKSWAMGDVLHSEPAIVHYTDEDIIFVGTNWGVMHCFKDSDGAELWGFIPPPHLSRLKQLSDSDVAHDYFIDGSPKVFTNADTGQKVLIFGERRGGGRYYALDVTDYTAPKWLYDINPTGYLGEGTTLGQSWGKPQPIKIRTGAGVDDVAKVFLMAGGYDENQDLDTPAANDTKGRYVYTVNIASGTVGPFKAADGDSLGSSIKHSIVDVVGYNTTDDKAVNRIYAPDLGGVIHGFRDDAIDPDTGSIVTDGTWEYRKLFNASADGTQRKVFDAPSVVTYRPSGSSPYAYGDMIFFGTGNRTNPTGTSVVNRFYCVKNDWSESTTLTEDDIEDVTTYTAAEDTAARRQRIKEGKGWFIRLTSPGEKLMGPPVVFENVVYFTTYIPEADDATSPENPCDIGASKGSSLLYMVDYQTGNAVFNNNKTNDGPNGEEVLTHLDRHPDPLPPTPNPPSIIISAEGVTGLVATPGGVETFKPYMTVDVHKYFWREIY